MDYDENDFQSLNSQLVGDDNKFPPSLRSFALPKFDFDDQLQVHLRFDSLVDTDVLLGVPGQGNNWIEDFTSGTSGIEFNSSTADNCSISRHKNVWSEATSSESVEMLLRSVGDDEMNDQKIITMEADAQNASDDRIVQTTLPLSRQICSDNTMKGDITQDDPSVPPDRFHSNLSGQDASAVQSQAQGLSQIFSGEISGAELNVGSLDDKFHSDEKTDDGQCMTGDSVTLQSDGAKETDPEISDTLNKMAHNDEPCDMEFMKASDGRDHDASEVARGGLDSITCGSTQEQVGKSAVTNMAERLDFISNDVQKGKGQMLSDTMENEQYLKDREVETRFCSRENSSFTDPARDSVVPTNDVCNDTGFPEKPDGLLEAITYQIKTLNSDNNPADTSSMQVKEMSSIETGSADSIKTDSVDVSKENFPDQLADQNEKGTRDTAKSPTDVLVHMDFETQKRTGDEDSSEINNPDSQTPESAVVEESAVTKVVENVEEPSSKLVVPVKVMLGNSPLPSGLKNAEAKISPSISGNLQKAVELSDVHTSLDISSGVEYAGPSSTPDITNSNNANHVIMGNAEADKVGIMSTSVSKNVAHAVPGTDLSSVSSELPSIVGDGSQEQKKATIHILEPDSISSDVKDANKIGTLTSSHLKSNAIISLSSSLSCGIPQDVSVVKIAGHDEPANVHQLGDTSDANMVLKQKEGEASHEISSDINETSILASSSLTKSVDNVDDKSRAESDIGEDSPLSDTTKPQTILVEQHLSYVESSDVSQGQLLTLADRPATQEVAKMVEGNVIIHESSVKGNDDKLEVASHEDKETTVAISAAPSSFSVDAFATLSGSNEEALLTGATCKPIPEPSCSSPTIINCSEHSQNMPEGEDAEKVKLTTLDSKESAASEDDRSFTFEVARVEELSEKDAGNHWKPFPSLVQSTEFPKSSKETREGCSEQEKGKHKASRERTSHVAKISNEKATPQKGRPAKGTSARKKSSGSIGKSSATSSAPVGTISRDVQVEEIHHSYTETDHLKTSISPIVQSSGLPDLNSSTARLFHQPFTDVQQVQLRAQIFVYGSLIQGIPPDESCMKSAFGEIDGGRSTWESAWRKSVERYQNQKSPVNSETPLHSRSVVRAPEEVKSSSLQSKAVSTSNSRSVGKVIAPAIQNSPPPLQSPVWSISTHDGLHSNLPRGAQLDFNQTLSPLHPYSSSQSRQLSSNSTPWLSQNPRPGPWAVSVQSPALNAGAQYSTVPVIETVQVTPVRDSSKPHAASIQLVSQSPLLPTPSSASAPSATMVHLETQRKTASPQNSKNASSVQKPRKRKKAAVTDIVVETIPVSQSSILPIAVTTAPKTLPLASPALPFTNIPSKAASQSVISNQYQTVGSGTTERGAIFSEETVNKIAQAKLQAEDAAAIAAAVVSHSQAIWNQLAAQRNSGLVKEVEEKLASAAVAVAAAAAVAKAAAEAAKVASEAALQAKTMVDEALDSAKTGSRAQSSEAAFDAGKSLAMLTPGSILKGKDKIHGSSSIISAAREATRRRVEATSAATKRAENLDAIMKAAELAAEAVSQVGTIIAMGDPLPIKLSELLEAGPEASWKAHFSASEKLEKVNKLSGDECNDLDHKGHHYEKTPINNREVTGIVVGGSIPHEQPIQYGVSCQGLEGAVENQSALPHDSHENEHSLLKENAIQKGSVVEVMSDEEGLKGVWFAAQVLDVKENKANVCYNSLLIDDGSDKLKEWVSLDSKSNGAPRIRIAHPMIAAKYDGTRKRRREAVGNYVWEVGDRVDARIRDGWWEGIITERSPVDETKLTVHFPAGGDTSLVRAWDLRPSLIWKDDQWIEYSRARENTLQPQKGDTPQEKRQKLGRLENKVDANIEDRGQSKKMPPGKVDLGPLNLSAKDAVFSVGKNASEAKISDAMKMKRTGLQKEGSGVVFGVPKPGKKRKFMEVSKHYVSDKTDKTREGNDSLKFANYLMPQASRPLRNTSKVNSKGNRTGDSKCMTVKSLKSQTSQTGSITEKENPSHNISASYSVKTDRGSSSNMGSGFSRDENNVEKNSVEVISFPRRPETKESLVAASSVQSVSTVPASKKKSSLAVDADLGVKGRSTPALTKSIRSEKKPQENQEKSISDATEPRRSNRRIQPTSRLLEGLQSSLIISKIPAFSHERGSKTLHRSSSSRGNARDR